MIEDSINGPGDPDLWPFDLETGMPDASKVTNLPCKFGHAGLLGSWIIRYVRDGWTDGQKQRLLPPFLTGRRGHKISNGVSGCRLSWTYAELRQSDMCCFRDRHHSEFEIWLTLAATDRILRYSESVFIMLPRLMLQRRHYALPCPCPSVPCHRYFFRFARILTFQIQILQILKQFYFHS